MADWNHQKIENLIELYKNHSELWNPQDNNYHIKNIKHDAWVKIAQEIDRDIDVVKTKMTSLLSSYRREKGKVKSSMGTGKGREQIYKSNWFAYPFFEFLADRDKPRNTVNTENISGEEEEPAADAAQSEASQNTTSEDGDYTEPEIIITQPKRKLVLSPREGNIKRNKAMKYPRLTHAYNVLNTVSSTPRDECSTYGEHVASKLRKFVERDRVILMHKMNNLIFEAEMEAMNSQQNC